MNTQMQPIENPITIEVRKSGKDWAGQGRHLWLAIKRRDDGSENYFGVIARTEEEAKIITALKFPKEKTWVISIAYKGEDEKMERIIDEKVPQIKENIKKEQRIQKREKIMDAEGNEIKKEKSPRVKLQKTREDALIRLEKKGGRWLKQNKFMWHLWMYNGQDQETLQLKEHLGKMIDNGICPSSFDNIESDKALVDSVFAKLDNDWEEGKKEKKEQKMANKN